MRDPFYRQIVAVLEAKDFGRDDFERCMCDLLRDHPFESLVPIPGGSDAGMDGAIADGEGAPYPLVCTTANRVRRNLTGSLKSYLKSGGPRRQAVLATSVALTPQLRRKLQVRAQELGFTLVQIFEQRAVADRLFYSERWCQELLGLGWKPQALSPAPRPGRPQLEIELIGRSADVKWLRTTTGDRLITGQPGSGKTYLLQHLTRKGWGLFLHSDDPSEIRNALIEQQPRVVIVDDAHEEPSRLIKLRQLREQTRQDFAIVAACWDGERDTVADALESLAAAQIHRLELLTADQIVEVIRQTGVRVRDNFMRFLRQQAANKPGLAVTLATFCLRGSWDEVLKGEALARSLMTDFSKLVDKDSSDFLAVLGIGGEQGMPIQAASELLEIGLQRARRMAIQLAMGGVLSEVGDRALAVQPEAFRSALIRRAFFEGPRPARLPYRPLIERAPSRESAVAAIITAAWYGAEVPAQELRSLVEECPIPEDWQIYFASRPNVWRLYSALGEEHARWAVDNYPGDLRHVATPETLLLVPQVVIPRLLERAKEESSTDSSVGIWPLDLIREWLQDLSAGKGDSGVLIRRRRLALRLTRQFVRDSGAGGVAIRVLQMALFPGLHSSSSDPGMGRTITTQRALLPTEQLSELLALWKLGRELIIEIDADVWAFLKKASWDWEHPESIVPMPTLETEVREVFDHLARQVLKDLSPLAAGSPGLAMGLTRLAKRLGFELAQSTDPVFELLYPEECYDETERRERERSAIAELGGLSQHWVNTRQPPDIAQELARYEAEAEKIAHQWPRRTPDLCRFLAKVGNRPDKWVETFLDHGLAVDLLRPFLTAMVMDRPDGWEELLARCLDLDSQAWGAVRLVLHLEDPPAQLLETALSRAADFPQLIEALCQRREVPPVTTQALLSNPDPMAALAAAVGEWNAEPQGEVTDAVRIPWRQAILRSARVDQDMLGSQGLAYWLRGILAADSELALEWVTGFLDSDPRPASAVSGIVRKAVDALDTAGRLSVLERFDADNAIADWLMPRVVGRSLAVFRRLLELDQLQRLHLRPFSGRPDQEWIKLARFALEEGKEPRSIAQASFLSGSFLDQNGFGSDHGREHWTQWDRAFAELEDDPNEDLREVARYGREQAQEEIRRSTARKRQHELDGL